jgi:hypothetical protein
MAACNVTVSKNTNGVREYLVPLPKVAIKLSHFEPAPVEYLLRKRFPCRHMEAIGKSSISRSNANTECHSIFLNNCSLANAVPT